MAKKKPDEPKPEASPFVEESEDQKFRRRSAELARARMEAFGKMTRAHLAHKEAKDAYESACEECFLLSDRDAVEYPLFPEAKPKPPEKPQGAKPDDQRAEPRDPFSLIFLSSMAEIEMPWLMALGSVGIQTVGDLEAWWFKGNQLEALPEIGPEGATAISGAIGKARKEFDKGQDAA